VSSAPGAVLFDFDGTLADSAPDLGAALNRLREREGLAPLSVEAVRPFASMGARGMLRVGFSLTPQDARYDGLRKDFLAAYEELLCGGTRLFPGMRELLDALEASGRPWGIVTNKARRFAEKIVAHLRVNPDCIVGGDDTPHFKPHPASLLLAAKQLALEPATCWYLGDDLRDIQAARAAGMRPVGVEWGYISPDNGGPAAWNADLVISEPTELLEHL
jgi:N-acetyl-D-muramate 6-phosphate phosphatase